MHGSTEVLTNEGLTVPGSQGLTAFPSKSLKLPVSSLSLSQNKLCSIGEDLGAIPEDVEKRTGESDEEDEEAVWISKGVCVFLCVFL